MKSKPNLKKILTAHPFLAGVKPAVREVFFRYAALQQFDAGQQLFYAGEQADRFYLVESGQVLLEMVVPGRGAITVQAVGPGEALGWSWLFPPHQWHFSAVAVKPTRAIAFPAKALQDWAKQDHEFCYELVVRLARVLVGRLEDVQTRLIYNHQYPPS